MKWFHPHYLKRSWIWQDVVHAKRNLTSSDEESVWYPRGALQGPHSGSRIANGHWNRTRFATIFSRSETCDSFLWGYIQYNAYRNNPTKSLLRWKMSLRRSYITLMLQHLSRVMQNFVVYLCYIIANDGSHIEHIIT